MESAEYFLKPTGVERVMNRAIGVAVRFGLAPGYIYLLQVQGRKSGKIYSTPVNLLEWNGRRYVVGGRGHTSWSRNAAAVGTVTLIRGKIARRLRADAVPDDQKPEILKAYLVEYRRTVQRFFSVSASSPVEAFRTVADRHPVFELIAEEAST
jgi:deazaflavin-dependent oxidoreductase (nitroreductase family)